MTKALVPRSLSLLDPKTFDELFDAFFINTRSAGSTSHPVHQYDIVDGNLQLEFSLAGYPKENLNVEVTDHTISVKANKVEEGGQSCFSKRAFTQSYRDAEGKWDFPNSDVSYNNGLLKIVVPPVTKNQLKALQIK